MLSQTDILHGKILIVDDQEANVRLLEQMLRGAGYDAITSTLESDKVCELHLLNRYDLILLDLQMPGMDGFQVMENLKEIEQDGYLPVLVITAQPEHKLRALRAGAKDFVSKPFDLAEVLLRVHNMLEVRMLHLEARRLYERIAAEQKVSEQRLLNGLPARVAERLKARLAGTAAGSTGLVSESYAEIAMLFADMIEFVKFSEGASAEALKAVLSSITACAGELESPDRTRTIGDAYMAAVGLPGPVVDHTIRAADMALDLSEVVDRFNARSRYKLKIGIGLDPKQKIQGKRSSLYCL